jgi:hypothetical protein
VPGAGRRVPRPRADGALADHDWRAVDLSTSGTGIVAGVGGALVATRQLGPPATTTTAAPGASVKLAGPSECVPGAGTLTATLTVKRRSRAFRRLLDVVFLLDDRRAATDRRGPFTQTLSLGGLPAGSTHAVAARARLRLRGGRTVTRIVQLRFTVCA